MAFESREHHSHPQTYILGEIQMQGSSQNNSLSLLNLVNLLKSVLVIKSIFRNHNNHDKEANIHKSYRNDFQ